MFSSRSRFSLFKTLLDLNGTHHTSALLVYLLVVAGHFSEHLVQAFQVFAWGWPRSDAGGILGLFLTGVAESELLHMTYNTLQLTGLILLVVGFRRVPSARFWWLIALAFQAWHWLEHAFLLAQLATGYYFYAAIKQTSVLERFVPRIELHLMYNTAVLVPTLIAVVWYFVRVRPSRGGS